MAVGISISEDICFPNVTILCNVSNSNILVADTVTDAAFIQHLSMFLIMSWRARAVFSSPLVLLASCHKPVLSHITRRIRIESDSGKITLNLVLRRMFARKEGWYWKIWTSVYKCLVAILEGQAFYFLFFFQSTVKTLFFFRKYSADHTQQAEMSSESLCCEAVTTHLKNNDKIKIKINIIIFSNWINAQ